MDVGNQDPVTGRLTTGHEWNGIEELETPIPIVVFLFLAAAFIFAVICWVLYPTWPLGTVYTKGLLGFDQRHVVTQQVAAAAADRATWTSKVEKMSYADIEADPQLMKLVKETGRTLFQDNCAACHGIEATGGPGFPNLAAKSWLWGGTPEAIEETIRVGINSTNDDTRVSQMMAFGRDGILKPDQILNVIAYVRSLSGAKSTMGDIEAGKQVFADNCVACHGENAKGSHDVGAPDLTDKNWIYGGSEQAVYTTVYSGRQGHMPNWGARLSPLTVKLLTLYVHTLPEASK
ncbi:cytochrome-c oxidase, cbb3-type subunit III [Mesorhizobium sp. SP-1A]|uniref:cytochrome-c oxidase, cbb3-type subunit III n=1 Tax=Mesorhizobium sp. SP-1A TaxID=3077840 RepID=UPI0028F73B62|nr:cytochrome-c oxidase, cbb3-type subunit III [Mesorhizobium sp. SP-1A]